MLPVVLLGLVEGLFLVYCDILVTDFRFWVFQLLFAANYFLGIFNR